MGKQLQHQDSSVGGNRPGSMWSLMSILDYHQWSNVKKILPTESVQEEDEWDKIAPFEELKFENEEKVPSMSIARSPPEEIYHCLILTLFLPS
ncbi:hypothetical protein DVH24_038664 [Malus domestica]|uniref:Uncharacterized protein n=1 Tax=Malus domestica TaxID=3750 RepID=A0A498K807_MALDO|nr:hypothetical protein DVH24_038664 [Malus domestica]